MFRKKSRIGSTFLHLQVSYPSAMSLSLKKRAIKGRLFDGRPTCCAPAQPRSVKEESWASILLNKKQPLAFEMALKDAMIGEYQDEVHAEDLDGLRVGNNGYKYRLLDGVMMPPYITPQRYAVSRSLATRPGDICYTSFPKSGSTWLSYILVLITNNGEAPKDSTLRNCLHWVASSWTYPRSAEELEALPSPRIFKSHMPYGMAVGGVPSKNPCRYVYIARNPKDVAVSYYFFESNKSWTGGYSGSWEDWLECFLAGRVQRGDWFDHVLSWWSASRTADNILFLTYEDLTRDFVPQVERLANFLGYSLSRDVLEKIHHKTAFKEMNETEFSNMHEIKEFNGFFRKAKIGSWREMFTPAQSAQFDKIYAKRMAGSGLDFDFGSPCAKEHVIDGK